MRQLLLWVQTRLPQGRGLTPELWQRRHAGMVRLLWVHVVVLGLLGLATGLGPLHALADVVVIAVPALLAGRRELRPAARSTACALGLVISSAIAVHLSGGFIEVHFHYFVMVTLLSLYQSWRPFLVAVGFVALQHGLGGWLFPHAVYNHPGAIEQPWLWAGIHGAFLLTAAVASLITWRLNEHQALHDGLTGLPNRALLADRLAQACRRRGESVVALLFIDLDNFKAVNDSAGHASGDDLLVAVADRLRGVTREGDTVARLGGDEFALLLDRMEDDTAAVRASTRILDALRDPFLVAGHEVYMTASVGVAVRYDEATDAASLLRHADMAMYVAKRQGKAQYEVFDREVHAAVVSQLELEADLQDALQNNELVLHYQPILTLDTEEIVGVEALVRWQHPRHGLLTPAQFIPLAEESGLIVPLGEWVLRHACAQMAAWNSARADRPLYLTVNLSPKQLRPGIAATVQSALTESGLPPTRLVLELTEAVLVGDGTPSTDPLHELRELGVRIAIDDFGTGYSSLNYLRRLPVDMVKIDRSFVQHLAAGSEDEAMVDAIIRLSRALGIQAVAEGVETSSEASVLRELGVPAAQGFLFARPADCGDIEALLAAAPTSVPLDIAATSPS